MSLLNAYNMAVELSNEEVIKAHIELIKEMKEDMKHNWSNAAILINKYAFFCKDLMEKPEDRLGG